MALLLTSTIARASCSLWRSQLGMQTWMLAVAATLGVINKDRDLNFSHSPLELEEYMEDYIQQFVPHNRIVYHRFDVYDLEEERL